MDLTKEAIQALNATKDPEKAAIQHVSRQTNITLHIVRKHQE